MERDGYRITTPLRTLLDAACSSLLRFAVKYQTAASFRRALANHVRNKAEREGIPMSRRQAIATMMRPRT